MMWRFIRRLFILLVVFTIAFLVYRYINPDWASILVDKIKSISDRFVGSDTKLTWESLNITGTTLFITWDMDVSNQTWENDNTWLEELNQEIEQIIWSSGDKNILKSWNIDLTNCISYFDGCNTCDVEDGEIIACTEIYCENYEEPKCLEYIWDNQEQGNLSWEEDSEEVSDNTENQEVDSWSENTEQEWLSEDDYNQTKNVFAPIVE